MPMMDRAYIVAHQVVERYLAGRLSETEVEQFEVYLLAHPELEDELRLTEKLKLGLKTLRERGELEALTRPKAQDWHRPAWVIAATVLVAVTAWGLVLSLDPVSPDVISADWKRHPLGLSWTEKRPSVSLRLAKTRDASSPVVLEMLARRRSIELMILPDRIVRDGMYRIRFSGRGAQQELLTEQEISSLRLGDDSNLRAYLWTEHLVPGEYGLLVTVTPPGEPEAAAGEFLLQLR